MPQEKRFLVDVGLKDLPLPIRVFSRVAPDGQATVGTISIDARIMHEFEPRWIDRFIRLVHQHRDLIGTTMLRETLPAYLDALEATRVAMTVAYPFFVEKERPVNKEHCLVRHHCSYAAKLTSMTNEPKIVFNIDVPCISTYPISGEGLPGGLFGQLSVVSVEIQSETDIGPETIVTIVDDCAAAPVYSFLTEADQLAIIETVHSIEKTSVVMLDEIKAALTRHREIDWYAVRCTNYGMLHSYSTVIGTKKSMWVPFSGYESQSI